MTLLQQRPTRSVDTLSTPRPRGLFRDKPVILVDEWADQGYLVDAATSVTSTRIAFMIRHSSGFLCVAMPVSDCDRLRIPLMPWTDAGGLIPGSAVAVDATNGIGTGISAVDRARTIGVLGDPDSSYTDLTRPGHVLPIRVDADSAEGCPDYARAALALVEDSHVGHAAAVAHLMQDSGAVTDGAAAAAFGREHGLEVVSFSASADHRRHWWPRGNGVHSRFFAGLRPTADRQLSTRPTFRFHEGR